MATALFDFSGHTLFVDFSSEALIEPLRQLLGPLEIAQSRGLESRWTIGYGSARAAALEPLLFKGQTPYSALECTMSGRDGHILFVAEDRIVIEIRGQERRGTIVVAPGWEWLLSSDFGMHVIDAALTMTGQTLIHGAALALPERAEAILMFAPSGTGKTTTALALARAGFGLMTDDVSVISLAENAVNLWGLPRALNIHRDTAELMPWLKPSLTDDWDRDGEQSVAIEELSGVGISKAREAMPAIAVVWLKTRKSGKCLFEKIDKQDLLIALSTDNVRGGMHEIPDYQMHRFRVLAEAVRRLPAYSLQVGENIHEAAAALRHGLDQARSP